MKAAVSVYLAVTLTVRFVPFQPAQLASKATSPLEALASDAYLTVRLAPVDLNATSVKEDTLEVLMVLASLSELEKTSYLDLKTTSIFVSQDAESASTVSLQLPE